MVQGLCRNYTYQFHGCRVGTQACYASKEVIMESTLIKDTTKQQRIELIKSWMPQEDGLDDCEIDLFDMYKDYIDGKREIREINESFSAPFYAE